MKNIAFLLLFTLGINTVYAECGASGMQFYPIQKEISLNSMFIIQGYGMSQKIINSFKDRIVYLESDSGELIELNLQELHKGQMRLTQAIFCTTTDLKPNTTYFLKYADQTENESREMIQYNREKETREKVYWKTSDKKTEALLNSNLSINYESSEVEHFGCGPSAFAFFNIKNKSETETWYKTEVLNITTNKSTTYYIKAFEETLSIGHGMCSGAFTFNKKGKYKVRFTPMNIDGKSLKTTEWITFDSPFKNGKFGF